MLGQAIVFIPDKPFQPILMFVIKPRACLWEALFSKYLQYWKYHLSFDDGEIFADIV
jgi:hypothetical protein